MYKSRFLLSICKIKQDYLFHLIKKNKYRQDELMLDIFIKQGYKLQMNVVYKDYNCRIIDIKKDVYSNAPIVTLVDSNTGHLIHLSPSNLVNVTMNLD